MIISIIGLGVVGGSFAKALKGKGHTVYGFDINEEYLKTAKQQGYIVDGFYENDEIIAQSDLTLICLYPSLVLDFIKNHTFKKGSIVSDAVGVKSYFLEQALAIMPEGVRYVSGHPMAGRESKGFEFASAEVFQGANYIIIQHETNTEEDVRFMEEFVRMLGFRTVKILSPYDHDEVISFTSQLPHCLAISLINSDTNKYETGKYIGDSYRDLTRIANINEDLWAELFLRNKQYLFTSIQNFEMQLAILKAAIYNDDAETLKRLFIEARKRRLDLEKQRYGDK